MNKEIKKILEEIRYQYNEIIEEKMKHLILIDNSDDNEYHQHRFLVEKEKADLLDDIIKFICKLK